MLIKPASRAWPDGGSEIPAGRRGLAGVTEGDFQIGRRQFAETMRRPLDQQHRLAVDLIAQPQIPSSSGSASR